MTGHITHLPPIPISDLSPKRPYRFDLRPDRPRLQAIAQALDLLDLRKLRLAGQIEADGRNDWKLTATLGATVTQPCVVTLDPVTTRLDIPVTRRFLKIWPPVEENGDEVEMPEDENIDPLGTEIDIESAMEEALALALPVYPRTADLAPAEVQATPPGAAPIEDEINAPFSVLADLKKKLEDESD